MPQASTDMLTKIFQHPEATALEMQRLRRDNARLQEENDRLFQEVQANRRLAQLGNQMANERDAVIKGVIGDLNIVTTYELDNGSAA